MTQLDQWDWEAQFPANGTLQRRPAAPALVGDSKRLYRGGQGLPAMGAVVESLLATIGAGASTICDSLAASVPEPNGGEVGPTSSDTLDWARARDRYLDYTARVETWWALDGPGDEPHESSLQPWVDPSRPPNVMPVDIGPTRPFPYWLQEPEPRQADPQKPGNYERLENVGNVERLVLDPSDWQSESVALLGLRSRLLDELEFNLGLQLCGNKANLLSSASLQLAANWLSECQGQGTVVFDFDRHGGRKRYLAMLLAYFPADWMEVVAETPAESIYRWRDGHRTVYFRFSVNGERRFPVAVASMASKYARELAIAALNAYWRMRAGDIQPTAGYPQDAARFAAEIRGLVDDAALRSEEQWRQA